MVRHLERLRRRIVADQVIGAPPGKYGNVRAETANDRVVTRSADQRIVAATAVQRIGNHIAGNGVIARATDRIIDIGSCVVIEQIGVVDVPGRIVPVSEIGELRARRDRGCAGIEIDRYRRRVIRQVIGIDTVAVPESKYQFRRCALLLRKPSGRLGPLTTSAERRARPARCT